MRCVVIYFAARMFMRRQFAIRQKSQYRYSGTKNDIQIFKRIPRVLYEEQASQVEDIYLLLTLLYGFKKVLKRL